MWLSLLTLLRRGIYAVVFVLAVWLAWQNMTPAELHLMPGLSLRWPLIALLFVALVLGVVAGVLVTSVTLFRQRRELLRLRAAASRQAAAGAAATPPEVVPQRAEVSDVAELG